MRAYREKCHTFDKLECLISCLLDEEVKIVSDDKSRIYRNVYCILFVRLTSIHSSSPVPARRGGRGLHDQGLRRASEERCMPRPLQRGLQERGEEGPPSSRGPQDGGEGPKRVRERDAVFKTLLW